MALRKKLHNELVDLKGNIRVFARVRPTIHEDGKGENLDIVTKFDPQDDQVLIVHRKGKDQVFELDHIFGPNSTQEQVFNQAKDIIISVIDGYNGEGGGARERESAIFTIFPLGQSASLPTARRARARPSQWTAQTPIQVSTAARCSICLRWGEGWRG
jgi:hypothetical protein